MLQAYVATRHDGERFIDTLARTGSQPFVDAAYATRREVEHALAG
jgi:hypothetical protein